jgi:hypothetical protein
MVKDQGRFEVNVKVRKDSSKKGQVSGRVRLDVPSRELGKKVAPTTMSE